MIVRDSARTLGDCLAGVAPWVDEMVVVDTGSTDETPAIAAAHGARVVRFPWCDDFAAARNESVRHARGRWVFWMDSDDTIDADNGRRIRELAEGTVDESVFGYVMQVHCPGGPDGRDVTVVDHVKLFRNAPHLRFEGRIHEQVLPAIRRSGGEVAWTDAHVVHSGADRSPAGRRRKHDRDMRLLRLDLAERPGHTFVLFNLGMTLADAGDHVGAVDALRRSINAGTTGESHLPKAHALLASSLGRLDRHADALTACEVGMADSPEDPELNFRAGLSAHRLGWLAGAVDYYRRALVPRLDRAFASVDRGITGYKAHYNLAAVYLDQKRPDEAEAAYREVVRLAPEWVDGWRALVGLLTDSGRREEAESCLVEMETATGIASEVDALRRKLPVDDRSPIEACVAPAGTTRSASPGDLDDSLAGSPFENATPIDAPPLTPSLSPSGYRGGEGAGGSLPVGGHDPFASVRQAERAVAADPSSADARTTLGIAMAEVGRTDLAAESFAAAVRLDPTRAGNHHNLGVALTHLGRPAEALASLAEASRLDPEHVEARRTTALALKKLGRLDESLGVLAGLVGRNPDHEALLVEYAGELRAAGRPAAAVGAFEAFASSVDADGGAAELPARHSAVVPEALGLAHLDAGQPDLALHAFDRVADVDPRRVSVHAAMAVAYARLGQGEEALVAYEQALLLHRAKPGRWEPEFAREVAELGLRYEARNDRAATAGSPAMPTDTPRFTVLVGCYGDHPDYSIRAMSSVVNGRDVGRLCDVVVGLNACCGATTARARELADAGAVRAVVESKANVNKDPMLRLMLEAVRTPYVLWMDDDSHFVDRNWPAAFDRFLSAEHPLDVAGEMARWGPKRFADPAYAAFAAARPWWIGCEHQPADLLDWIPFVVGGLFVARTAFLRLHDFPDRGMVKALDDVALGELVQQVGGRLVGMPRELLATARISDGHRRGENYLLREGGPY